MRLLGFRTSAPSSEFGGFPKKLPGHILGKFGDLSESKFLENFVPGVSVSLPLSVFRSLFPCVRIYLFRNLCLSLSIFVHLCVCQPVSFWCLRLSVSTCLSVSLCLSGCLGLSLFVSMCPWLSFVSIFFASFCVSLSIFACPRLSIW